MIEDGRSFFDDEFSDSFIDFLEELKRLDSRSLKQPIYLEVRELVFKRMRERFLRRMLHTIGAQDMSGITLDRAVTYYANSESGDVVLDYIASRIHPWCEQMHVSTGAYGPVAFCSAVLIALGRDDEAYFIFSVMMRPLVAAFRRREAAQSAGKSGRPTHRHKGEALDIAAEFKQETPNASLYRIVQVVAGELARQYTDAPSARAIETWLKQRGYKR